jgi:hypothetical protein
MFNSVSFWTLNTSADRWSWDGTNVVFLQNKKPPRQWFLFDRIIVYGFAAKPVLPYNAAYVRICRVRPRNAKAISKMENGMKKRPKVMHSAWSDYLLLGILNYMDRNEICVNTNAADESGSTRTLPRTPDEEQTCNW